jgi:hypothetical protein
MSYDTEYGVQIRSTKSEYIWQTTSRGRWLASGCKHNQAKTKYQTSGYLIAQRTRENHVFKGKGLTFVVTRIIEKQMKRRHREIERERERERENKIGTSGKTYRCFRDIKDISNNKTSKHRRTLKPMFPSICKESDRCRQASKTEL